MTLAVIVFMDRFCTGIPQQESTRFGLKIMEPWTDDLILMAEHRDGDHVLDVACGTGLGANRIN